MLSQNTIFTGVVYHARHTPFFHEFKYNVYSMWIDLDELDNSAPAPRFFSFNKWNLLSLNLKNHGPRDGSKIRPWIEAAAVEKNIDIEGGKIYMLCFPRVLGYVFSPLTVYFCYNKNNELTALLHQVKNTFGGQHGYLLPVEKADTIKQSVDKIFHVSPFIQMDSTYNFKIKEPSDKGFTVAIHQTIPDGKMLTATWTGTKSHAFNSRNLMKIFWSFPLQSLKVIITIHWQALRLWLKGAKFRTSPPLPEKDIT
jgi:DUF1365 family protein